VVTLDMGHGSDCAPPFRRVLAQARFDTANVLRNGENLLLTMVIPVAVLLITMKTPLGGDRTPQQALVAAAGLAVLATAFTSQAISTGFDRRYGVLRMLGLSPLGPVGLLAARTLVSVMIITLQLGVLLVLTGVLGSWWPGEPAQAAQAGVAVVLAVCAFTAWALLLAGTLRAEATLAVANAVFLVLMVAGGLAVPAEDLPWGGAAGWLPTGALVEALSSPTPAWAPLAVLFAWAAVGTALAARFFRWES
jgi:ABC-2 type transport system permease protein